MRMATSSPARCSRGEPTAIPPVDPGPCRPAPWDQRRGDHLAVDAHAVQQPGQLEAGRAGLVAGSQPAGVAEAANEPADRRLIVGDPLHVWDLLIGRQGSPPRSCPCGHPAEVDGHTMRDTGHGRLLPSVGSARLGVGDPRNMRDRSRPFHADYRYAAPPRCARWTDPRVRVRSMTTRLLAPHGARPGSSELLDAGADRTITATTGRGHRAGHSRRGRPDRPL